MQEALYEKHRDERCALERNMAARPAFADSPSVSDRRKDFGRDGEERTQKAIPFHLRKVNTQGFSEEQIIKFNFKKALLF